MEEILRDPITMDFMENAVMTPYGHSFSEDSLKAWLDKNSYCPVTKRDLCVADLRPNFALRQIVCEYKKSLRAGAKDLNVELQEFVGKFRSINQALFDTSVRLEFLKAELENKNKVLLKLGCSKRDMGEKLADISVQLGYFHEYKDLLERQLDEIDKEIQRLNYEENTLCTKETELKIKLLALQDEYQNLSNKYERGDLVAQGISQIEKKIVDIDNDIFVIVNKLKELSSQKTSLAEKGSEIRKKRTKTIRTPSSYWYRELSY